MSNMIIREFAKILFAGGTCYPDRMGTAARLALGIPQEV